MKLLELVEQLFAQYGYWVLLLGLPLDAIALPIPPGNTTITYTGFLSYSGVLFWLPAIAAAIAGSIIGITVTYLLGYRLGNPLIERYGKWLFLKPEHIEKTRKYYDKYGNKVLLFSYFIPGLRQFIGYFVGIIRIPYRTFALYAYSGAAIWVVVFFSIGFFFGDQWPLIQSLLERYLKYIVIAAGALIIIYIIIKRRSRRAKA
ncbi:DedA family protein [Paenibacillus sp. GCM10027626]|uniref:DedA family protein n=1 Tax=Paenibacillus sp. GCM10027626 TaxID=3273411 RepID=UPI0036403A66